MPHPDTAVHRSRASDSSSDGEYVLASTAALPRTTQDAARKHHVQGDGVHVDVNECLLSAAAVKTTN